MKYGLKVIQELIAICIIGAVINIILIDSKNGWLWLVFIYGLLLYGVIAFAIYDFEMSLDDLKEKEKNKINIEH